MFAFVSFSRTDSISSFLSRFFLLLLVSLSPLPSSLATTISLGPLLSHLHSLAVGGLVGGLLTRTNIKIKYSRQCFYLFPGNCNSNLLRALFFRTDQQQHLLADR
jgi:hypothetical protein